MDLLKNLSLSLALLTTMPAHAVSLTGGEMDKLASNIGVGRAHAAVHWRYDYIDSLPLGEAVAIAMLRDMASCWNESFEGFSFTKFNGKRITGVGKNS